MRSHGGWGLGEWVLFCWLRWHKKKLKMKIMTALTERGWEMGGKAANGGAQNGEEKVGGVKSVGGV